MMAGALFCALFVAGSIVFLPSREGRATHDREPRRRARSVKKMLSIRWDTLVVAIALGLTLGYLVLQFALRTNLARLLQAFRLARRNAAEEPNLYDFLAERRTPGRPPTSGRRRVS
jgi:hypothetical protein